MKFVASRQHSSLNLLVFGILLALGARGATIDGSVTGSVVDNAGLPVAGARVFISQALPPSSKPAGPPTVTGPRVATVTTDAAGAFSVGKIQAGQYVACAETAAAGLLDPCHWAASAPEFTVVAGEALGGITIPMARGAVLSINVSDPQGLLSAVTGTIDPACRFDIVTAKGLHYSARIQASAAGSRNHAITIPFGTPLNLQVISPHLVLADSTGKTISSAAAVSVAAGVIPATIAYTVTGPCFISEEIPRADPPVSRNYAS